MASIRVVMGCMMDRYYVPRMGWRQRKGSCKVRESWVMIDKTLFTIPDRNLNVWTLYANCHA